MASFVIPPRSGFPNPTELAGSRPPEWLDPRAASLGLGPEPTTFEIFASWMHRTFPGEVSESLQHLVTWLASQRAIVESWSLNQDDSVTLKWGPDLSATVLPLDRVEWKEKGKPAKVLHRSRTPDSAIEKIRDHKKKMREAKT